MAITAASNGHIRKRQFQPSITSYFNNRNADSNTLAQLQRGASQLVSPALPGETQSSLLSVGMRVRKSVPEGYKTHKTLGMDGLPFPSTAPAPATTPSINGDGGRASSRELAPFCGLHKTGGWASQDAPASSAPAAMQGVDDGDEYGILGMTMSQSTLSSTQHSFLSSSSAGTGTSRKRTYDEEIEDEMDAYFDETAEVEMAEHYQPQSNRPIAKMKSSKAAPTAANGRGMVCVFGEDDFEDANFLAPPDGMDVDGM